MKYNTDIKIECKTCINRTTPDKCQTCISNDLDAIGIKLYRNWTPKTEKPSWSETAFELMDVIAKRSDDPHTRVGAVIMDLNNRIVSMGYNGFPQMVTHKPERTTRENGTKYLFMVHAEQNAINFADRERLKGSSLYVPFSPCARCAQDIIQTGITAVYVDAAFQREYSARASSNYTREFEAVQEMFKEAGVRYVEIERDA